MSKLYRMNIVFVIVFMVASCVGQATESPPTETALPELPEIHIARHPEPDDYSNLFVYTEFPAYDPNSMDTWQVDLRSADLTEFDLSRSIDELLHANFDSKTQWPNNLPDATLTVRYYSRRMWIEEMFGDFKKQGFDLERTLLQQAPRLSRLCIVYPHRHPGLFTYIAPHRQIWGYSGAKVFEEAGDGRAMGCGSQ